MWFRRNKKGDADSALSDTLMTLQSLLDEKKPGSPDTGSVERATAPAESRKDTVESTTLTRPRGKNIKNAVASEEHLEWDFKVDMAGDETSERTTGRAFLKAVESDELSHLESLDGGAVVPIRHGKGSVADPTPDKPVAGPVDNIPVLMNIAYLPGAEGPGSGELRKDHSEAPFVDRCLKDLEKRLKQNELTPLTPSQEKRFRTALTSLLLQKTSGKFE